MAGKKDGRGGGITKQEAVRRALAELGPDAKPLAIQAFLRDRRGMEVKTDLISFYKKAAKKKAKAQGRATPQGPAARTASAPPAAAPKAETGSTLPPPVRPQPAVGRGGQEAAIPLADILYVKRLVGRHGAGPLHTLVDAFAQ
jgi:hypothetical protein